MATETEIVDTAEERAVEPAPAVEVVAEVAAAEPAEPVEATPKKKGKKKKEAKVADSDSDDPSSLSLLGKSGLTEKSVAVLRKYANHLGMKGFSKVSEDGKAELVDEILKHRRELEQARAGHMRGKKVKVKDLRGEARQLGETWTCSRKECGHEGPPDDFGYRTQHGKLYKQTYCRKCRALFRGKKKKKPGAETAGVEVEAERKPKAEKKPKVGKKPKAEAAAEA